MLMTEYIDKIDQLTISIKRINAKLATIADHTSAKYHKLRKEEKQLKKQRNALEHECYR